MSTESVALIDRLEFNLHLSRIFAANRPKPNQSSDSKISFPGNVLIRTESTLIVDIILLDELVIPQFSMALLNTLNCEELAFGGVNLGD